jgi:hypothetical protein
VRVSSPIVEAEVRQSKEQAQQLGAKVADDAVQVWQGKKTSGLHGSMVGGSIPTRLPTDREICIMTIRENRGKKGDEGFEEHVIRVMCKVVSNKEKPTRAQTPAQ